MTTAPTTTAARAPGAPKAPRARSQAAADAARSRRNTLGGSRGMLIAGLLALAIAALLWALPMVFALATSFKTETDATAAPLRFWPENGWTFENYAAVLSASGLPRWILNSVLVSVAVTALTLLVSIPAAYAFSRHRFRGRGVLFALTIAAIMVPPQILIVPLFEQMKLLRLSDTLAGVALPQVVAPLMVIVLKNFFDQIPRELEEAARIDGATNLRTMMTVVMPLSRSIIVAVGIFVFIGAWNNFLWPFIITNSPELMTIPVGLGTVQNAYGLQIAQDMASAVVGGLPLLIVFVLFQRQIVKGFASAGLGGGQ